MTSTPKINGYVAPITPSNRVRHDISPKDATPIFIPNTSRSVLEGIRKVKVTSACQIDGPLMALHMLVKSTSTSELDDISDSILGKLMDDLKTATERTKAYEARARFLLDSEKSIPGFLSNVSPDLDETNLLGNDVDLLGSLFQPLMELN